jgi:hypothetical protein
MNSPDPHRGRGGGAGRANPKKDLVTARSEILCPTGCLAYFPAALLAGRQLLVLGPLKCLHDLTKSPVRPTERHAPDVRSPEEG